MWGELYDAYDATFEESTLDLREFYINDISRGSSCDEQYQTLNAGETFALRSHGFHGDAREEVTFLAWY